MIWYDYCLTHYDPSTHIYIYTSVEMNRCRWPINFKFWYSERKWPPCYLMNLGTEYFRQTTYEHYPTTTNIIIIIIMRIWDPSIILTLVLRHKSCCKILCTCYCICSCAGCNWCWEIDYPLWKYLGVANSNTV